MSRKKIIWILSVSGVLLLAGFVGIGLPFYRHVRAFFVEDEIHGTFYPLAMAFFSYQKEYERPADSLAAIVPKYIEAIPYSRLAEAPTYRILPDGQSWELAIRSRALPEPRLYVCRSTDEFSSEERQRIIIRYHHTWTVLRDSR